MRFILGILCAFLLCVGKTTANTILAATESMTLTVPTQTKTDSTSGLSFSLSDSISDSTATASGGASGFTSPTGAARSVYVFNFSGEASGETIVDLDTNFNLGKFAAFLNSGIVTADAGSTTTMTVMLDQVDGAITTPIFSYTIASTVTPSGYHSFEKNFAYIPLEQPQTLTLDIDVAHTGPGNGTAQLNFAIAPVPTTLCGALSMLCLVCGLEMRKRRLLAKRH